MTELQKQLLGDLREDKVSVDTILPQKLESSGEATTEFARDESTLTYDELIEDFITFNKSGIMTELTFWRLWNS